MITLLPTYKPLFNTDKRYILITGGRGSAKSFHATAMCSMLTYEQGHRILFTRYTMTSAGLSIIPEFVEKIELLKTPHHFEVTNNYIQNTQTSSDVLFKGIKTSSGNQTASLKSLQGVTTWVLDEAEELIDEDTFDTIDLSIRKKDFQNRIILIMNPTTKEHWVWKRFFDGHLTYKTIEGEKIPVSTHPDLCHIHTTYLDNKANLAESYLKQIESIKTNNPNKYKHKILGGWIERAEGTIFNNWNEGAFDTSLPYCYGQDYGFSIDPTVLLKIAIDEKRKKVYIHELLYTTAQLGTDDLLNTNKRLIEKPTDLIVADAAEDRLIHDLRSKGLNIIPCKKGAGSVVAGITALQDYELIVTPESMNVKKELNNYSWNDRKAGVPNDTFNHALDSLRYAFGHLSRPKMFIG